MRKAIIINNLKELPEAVNMFLETCKEKKIFAFYGQMGAGKTTFIKALCEALGVSETVSSPTFSIVNEYVSAAGRKIFHFDFYRIKSESEAFDMGYEDYFYSDAFSFIEWPEKIEGLLPPDCIKAVFALDGEKRILHIETPL